MNPPRPHPPTPAPPPGPAPARMTTWTARPRLRAPRSLLDVTAGLAMVMAVCLSALPARALPPGGAGESTAGTSSTVTGQVGVGGTISFTVSGFPAGETVYVKIDDGLLSGEDETTQGTGVVHSQAIGANGTASGSFVLPSYVREGQHWLRFLATSSAGSKDGGNVGYTNRSPNFTVGGSSTTNEQTVTEGGGGGAGAGSSNDTTTTTIEEGAQAAASAAGATAAADAPTEAEEAQLDAQASPTPAEETAASTEPASAPTIVAAAPVKQDNGFPIVGASVLGATVLIVVVALAVAVTRRIVANRQ